MGSQSVQVNVQDRQRGISWRHSYGSIRISSGKQYCEEQRDNAAVICGHGSLSGQRIDWS